MAGILDKNKPRVFDLGETKSTVWQKMLSVTLGSMHLLTERLKNESIENSGRLRFLLEYVNKD